MNFDSNLCICWVSRLEASATHVNISSSVPEDSEVVLPQILSGNGAASLKKLLAASMPPIGGARYAIKVLMQSVY